MLSWTCRYLLTWNQWDRLRLELFEEPILECIALYCHSMLCSIFVRQSTLLLPMVGAIPNFVWLSVVILHSSKQSLCVNFLFIPTFPLCLLQIATTSLIYIWSTIAEKFTIVNDSMKYLSYQVHVITQQVKMTVCWLYASVTVTFLWDTIKQVHSLVTLVWEACKPQSPTASMCVAGVEDVCAEVTVVDWWKRHELALLHFTEAVQTALLMQPIFAAVDCVYISLHVNSFGDHQLPVIPEDCIKASIMLWYNNH